MDDLNIIDQFMAAFVAYIDSGFGLLGPDVGFLTTALIGIDITLAGLFWALGGEDDVIAKLLRKILYVGAFALILNNFQSLADIIFRSFAGLGLTAGGSAIGAADLLLPGRLGGTGFEAASPLLESAKELVGPIAFFENFVEIAVLLFAWLIVIAAFFVLAVQMFITILEFKLTALAGFVLVPFALWNRTAFLAGRLPQANGAEKARLVEAERAPTRKLFRRRPANAVIETGNGDAAVFVVKAREDFGENA